MKRLLILTLLLLVAPAAVATDFASHDLVIPVGGRAAGLGGSVWRTDVYVTNVDRRSLPPVDVTIVAGSHVFQAEIPPRATVVIRDLTHSQGVGLIRIASTSPDAKLSARARIFNIGSAQGEFGQTAPAIPVSKLSKEAYLPGLSGVLGNRTNVGVANPGATPANVFISIFDEFGEFRGGFSDQIAPRSLQRYDDVFRYFDDVAPFDNATVQVMSTSGVYAYASVVRNDTGDADFVTGTGVVIDDSQAIVQPDCASPAALHLTAFPSVGWIVTFYPGTPAASTTQMLAAKYGFTPGHIYEDALQGFTAELTQQVIAKLRCEPLVRAIDQNAYVPLP